MRSDRTSGLPIRQEAYPTVRRVLYASTWWTAFTDSRLHCCVQVSGTPGYGDRMCLVRRRCEQVFALSLVGYEHLGLKQSFTLRTVDSSLPLHSYSGEAILRSTKLVQSQGLGQSKSSTV